MQALARVNRRFRGKEDGLLVGYAPLADKLRDAIKEYWAADQQDRTLGQDVDRALDEGSAMSTTLSTASCGATTGAACWARPAVRHSLTRRCAPRTTCGTPRPPATTPRSSTTRGKPWAGDTGNHAHRLERFYALTATSANISERFPDHPATWRRDIQFFVEVAPTWPSWTPWTAKPAACPSPAMSSCISLS
jgi:type I restriction enzyme R subunit